MIKKITTILMMLASMAVAASCGVNGNGSSADEKKPESKTDKKCRTWGEEGIATDNFVFIANGKVQLGVDMDRGGSIFHFSTSKEKINRLNHADEGRFIQQSYYGNDGKEYTWTNSGWCWNPIQGGGCDGQKSKVVSKKVTGTSISVVSTPMQWGKTVALDKCELATDCVMSEELKVIDNYAELEFTFKYNGDKDLGTHSAEVPAFFCDWDLNNYACYSGDAPWTDDEITVLVPKVLQGIANPNPSIHQTEEWSAYINDDGYGIGLYTPGTDTAIYYTAGAGPGGAKAGSCSYFAPIRNLHITPGFEFNYKAYLTIGTIDEIRATFKKIHDEN